jgi:serine/threonine-protein kinase
MLQPGRRLGPYVIISFLAKGGMGEIFIARDTRLDREVAIKVLTESHLGSYDAIVRFEREAKALAALSHPNILTIYDVGSEEKISYVVMELLRGESLRAKLIRGALSKDELRKLAFAVLEGLAAAHSKGIIHRDLKPENIFITNEGVIKILDFGLAHIKQSTEIETLSEIATQNEIPTQEWSTKSDALVGTLLYMAPEQIRGGSASATSDIFSLGALLYECATGIHPFWGQTVKQIITNIQTADPLIEPDRQKQIPKEFEKVIRRSLSKESEKRYQNATEMLNELRAVPADHMPLTIPKKQIIFGSAVMAFLLILFAIYLIRRSEVEQIHSIAILPFINRTNQPDLEYLSDGITERIISDLSQIKNLKVMASGTVFSYKGKTFDPRKVGKELNVDAVASGSVTQQESNLVVQTEVVNIKDGSVLWAKQYERNISEIMRIQAEVSAGISENLKLELKSTKPLTTSAEAYQQYLRGRYFWIKFTPESQRKSLEYFNNAIEKDPEYSLAWAGLSDAYGSLATNGWIEPDTGFQLSKTAALKAVSLRSDLAEGQHALGAVLFFYERDWSGAENQFKRAIDLNPNFADAYCVYSYLLSSQGRSDEALSNVKIALELNPLDLKSMTDMASVLYWSRDFNGALNQINSVLEMVPEYEPALNMLVYVYTALGNNEQAIQTALKAVEVSHESPIELATLGYAYGVSEKTHEAEEILKRLEQKLKSKNEYISDFYLGHIYTGLGKKDLAFHWLMKACSNWKGDWGMLFVKSAYSDSLRSDARFKELLHCMKFM